MSNAWFRMYAEFASDPKVQMMSEAYQRRFIMLLCIRCCNDHVTFQDEEVAFQLRISNEEWAETKAVFLGKNLINEDNAPTAWDKRQFRSDSSAERVRKHREAKKSACNVTVTAPDTETDTDTEESISSANALEVRSNADGHLEQKASKRSPSCPHQKVIDLYHGSLPTCPQVREWNATRQKYLQSRWREKASALSWQHEADGLDWFKRFFGWVAESDFLTGKADGRNGQPPFVASLEWLMRPSNFAKVVEGKYHA